MTSHVIGIDIGLSGAMALLGQSGLMATADIPTMVKGAGTGKVKNEINPAALNDILREWSNGHADDVLVAIEQVASMPGQGVGSVMSLGDSRGCIRGVVAARGYATQWVVPQQWKKHFGLKAPAEENKNKRQAMMKELARAKAIQLYPAADLARKADHNRAEAILLARYAWECLR